MTGWQRANVSGMLLGRSINGTRDIIPIILFQTELLALGVQTTLHIPGGPAAWEHHISPLAEDGASQCQGEARG